MKHVGLYIFTVVFIVVVVFGIRVYLRFRHDIKATYGQIANLNSRKVETPCGPVEYATLGHGYPVLVIHGVWGGIDQGMAEARNYPVGFNYIVVSRFGYLRTPMPQNPSPELQADAYASLLDNLGIQKRRSSESQPGDLPQYNFPYAIPNGAHR